MLNVKRKTGLCRTAGAMVAGLMASSIAFAAPAYASSTNNTHGSIQATGATGPNDSMPQTHSSQQSMAGPGATNTTNNTHGSIQATGASGN